MLDQAQNKKHLATAKQLIRKNPAVSKSGNFFHKANVQMGFTPSPPALPLFV